MTTYTVGDLATMAGITVRTLHHYDEIGLLRPAGRTQAGYRLYDDGDIDRLRTILSYRELGLGLDEIARAVADRTQAETALHDAHARVTDRITRLEVIAASLARALNEPTDGGTMTAEEKLTVFGDFDPDEHIEEAARRWADTEAYSVSTRRTSNYTKADWETITAELDDILRRFLALRDSGVTAGSPEAATLVDEHRAHLSRWYYDVTPQVHRGLGEIYTADARFTNNIDTAGDGLAAFMSEAIAARYA